MILYTIVVSPRYSDHGTTCHGLYRTGEPAQDEMERMVTEVLEDDGSYSKEEIDDFMGLDTIDLPSTSFYVAPVYLDCGEVTATQIF